MVVGAGAAGIIAAWRAASLGAKVVLLEKTPRLGTKILISGGGKCNITHDGPLEHVLRAFRPNEARFIRPACYRFTNTQIVEMLTSRGLEVYTRPDGRIFPTEGTAKDVVAILRSYLFDAGVEVRLNTPVSRILTEGGRVTGVETASGVVPSRQVIVAVGGSSYPNSGTTGDGFTWMRDLGHSIVRVRAALAPMTLSTPKTDLSGVALRDCILKARQAGKEFVRWRGDTLLTHHGVSGPTALAISREVSEHRETGPVELETDLYPDESFEVLGARLASLVRLHPKRLIATHLEAELPDRIVPELLRQAAIAPDAVGTTFTQKERNRLVEALKGWKLGLVKVVVLDKGEVVAGGVALDEVDPHSMKSKLVDGLFLCGEVLDIAGPVGGYNLQAAFATGYVSGESAASIAGFSP